MKITVQTSIMNSVRCDEDASQTVSDDLGSMDGLRLTCSPDRVSIGEVFRLFESRTPFAECFDPEQNTCPLAQACRLRNYITRALEAFYHELGMVTLDDLVRGNCGLQDLLQMFPPEMAGCDRAGAAVPDPPEPDLSSLT